VPTDATKPNRVVTVSRLVEKKGLSYALEAVAAGIERIPDIQYHVVGSGHLKAALLRKSERLGIADNVVFLDNVSDQRLLAELDEARCFLLPSVITDSGDRDGIPIAMMEAMAMKTPPVSTTISGIPELVDHGRNGLLTEPRNVDATVEALLELLRNDPKWTAFSERAREKVVSEFNVRHEAPKLETTFRKARRAIRRRST